MNKESTVIAASLVALTPIMAFFAHIFFLWLGKFILITLFENLPVESMIVRQIGKIFWVYTKEIREIIYILTSTLFLAILVVSFIIWLG